MKSANKKTGAIVAAGLIGVALLLPSVASAFEINYVGGATVTVNASVTGSNTLTTQAKSIAGNGSSTTITYATIVGHPAAWSTLADQYIQISVDDNAPSWRLRSFTNNFVGISSVPTNVWGYAYGGLKGDVNGAKAAVAWRNNSTILSTGPTTGNPQTGTNGWTFIKDMRDEDDPIAVGDQSFVAADLAGYTNIAFGAPSYTRMVNPTVEGGSESLATITTPWFYYTEADFSPSPAATYSTSLVLELLNQ